MNKSAVRWGILGAGRVASDFVAALRPVDDAVIMGVAARSSETARNFATRHDLPAAYVPYSQLVERADIDVIYVATPNSTHPALVAAALSEGKHVLCEKPLAPNGDVAASLFDQAEGAGLIVAEAFMYRYHSQSQALLEIISSGGIGSPRLFRGGYSFPLTDPDDIRLQPQLQGGALWDIGVYPVNLARAVFQEPMSVWGIRSGRSGAVDRSYVGVLQFSDECIAFIDCSFDLPLRRWVEVVGTKGLVRVENAFMPCRGRIEFTGPLGTREISTGKSNPYTDEARVMTNSIRDGTDETLGREDAVGNARTLAALYRSAAAAHAVKMGTGT